MSALKDLQFQGTNIIIARKCSFDIHRERERAVCMVSTELVANVVTMAFNSSKDIEIDRTNVMVHMDESGETDELKDTDKTVVVIDGT